MGSDSRVYSWYYGAFFLTYLVISIASFAIVSSTSGQCVQTCPLKITSDARYNFGACSCVAESPGNLFWFYGMFNGSTTDNEIYNNAIAVTQARGNCYACNSINPMDVDIYLPCSPRSSCTVPNMVPGFRIALSSDTSSNSTCSLLTSNTVSMRGSYSAVLYAFSVFFLLMSLCALLLAIAFSVFIEKWHSDYTRLSKYETFQGFVAKNFVVPLRVCNILLLIFIIWSLIMVFGYDVCSTERNPQNGKLEFFSTISGLVIGVSLLWIVGCIVGSCFNRVVPKDTPFYNPKTASDPADHICYRVICGTKETLARVGP